MHGRRACESTVQSILGDQLLRSSHDLPCLCFCLVPGSQKHADHPMDMLLQVCMQIKCACDEDVQIATSQCSDLLFPMCNVTPATHAYIFHACSHRHYEFPRLCVSKPERACDHMHGSMDACASMRNIAGHACMHTWMDACASMRNLACTRNLIWQRLHVCMHAMTHVEKPARRCMGSSCGSTSHFFDRSHKSRRASLPPSCLEPGAINALPCCGCMSATLQCLCHLWIETHASAWCNFVRACLTIAYCV